ncbi:NADP-dependent oxidoreductase [Tardiphaga sp. vice352]|uniref:NADP-dependent oxidoreductase n=1 Tax=unclassified Tardiphaga TaxID=2631404 RepID=UPI001163B938|nr:MULTISPECIES: NADP-dependent oxidoreductase [unclassified Tardiphaga]QDM16805.1 NADP-dependent oxidoreductase [Tardiphaga sp. vice278]QDM21799.1 NADP-dependent oxidoreductase [Tardiphaga sp. vice154]QDM32143.1 NADP-dependent oxidoreductase [Tardiphaga sp. vice352]
MTASPKRIVLAARPHGEPKPSDFRLEDYAMPELGEGQVLLRTIWLSLDPYMRGRMNDAASYSAPVAIDAVMEGGTVCEVMASNSDAVAKGDLVLAHSGWQTYSVVDGNILRKIDPSLGPISTAIGILGMPGMTAYTGLLDIGQPKAGETVVVAAASGAVGSAVGQIAMIKGARAVGIAGGKEKCDYVKNELGFSDCLDHRDPDFAAKLKAACPDGIDVYFENVGGEVFEAVFPLLNFFARIPVCGLIASYSDTADTTPKWAGKMMRTILTKRLTFRGFIVSDFAGRRGDFLRDMSVWVKEGKVKYKEFVTEGLDSAPEAFMGLLKGKNFGKQLVRVGPDKV